MKWIHWAILAALLASPAILITSYAVEFLAVDSALDAGASYDYTTDKADHSQNHPYIPYSQRHGPLIAVSACSFFAALFFSAYLVSHHLTKRSS